MPRSKPPPRIDALSPRLLDFLRASISATNGKVVARDTGKSRSQVDECRRAINKIFGNFNRAMYLYGIHSAENGIHEGGTVGREIKAHVAECITELKKAIATVEKADNVINAYFAQADGRTSPRSVPNAPEFCVVTDDGRTS